MAEEFTWPDPAHIPLENVPPMLAQLAALQSALAAKLVVGKDSAGLPLSAESEAKDLLTPDQAAALLSVSVDWMYRHAAGLPFTRRLSRKALRFSKAGLLRWRAGRRT